MEHYPQSVCRLIFLSFCCVLIIVKGSDSTFVPGRCLCPATQARIRGQLKELTVFPKNPSCNNITVIVTLTNNNEQVCLDPEAGLGKQLIRCWNRAHKMHRDTKVCLKRRKKKRRGGQQRRRGHNRKASSSNS